MADVDFNWSVQKLQELRFDGDADALAAYVNALIENNRDAEDGDPDLLRARARQELEDFLGEDDAASFVDALMAHLSGNGTTGTQNKHLSPSRSPNSESAKREQTISASNTRQSFGTNDSMRENVRALYGNADGSKSSEGRHMAGVRENTAEAELYSRQGDELSHGREFPTSTGGSTSSRQSRDLKDPNLKDLQKLNEPSASTDLRYQLSRSRLGTGMPAKRPREGEERSPDDTKRREVDITQGKDKLKDHQYKRDDNRDRRYHSDTKESNKFQRRSTQHNDAKPNGVLDITGNAKLPGLVPVPGAAPLGFLPPPPPEFLNHMRQMMSGGHTPHGFPPPPGLIPSGGIMAPGTVPSLGAVGRGNAIHSSRGLNRGGVAGHGRQSQHGASHARGRSLNSVLIMRNVPTEKLTLGAINEFFQKFGSISNIQLRPAQQPDHAFIEFSNRVEAQAAYDSVDAVMGNRHIKLYWARESDYEHDGIPLSGVELAPSGHAHKATAHIRPQHQPNSKQVDVSVSEEDPEAVLQRKRKEIAAAREEQEKAKVERQAEYDKCITEQKELFEKLESGCSPEEKKELLKRIKVLRNNAESMLLAIKGRESGPKVSAAVSDSKPNHFAGGQGHGRARGPMSADFRPKVAYIRGATTSSLDELTAVNIFHDTSSAKFVDGIWVLDFASRRAAESATKATRVLKQWFGPNANISLSDSRTPQTANSFNTGTAIQIAGSTPSDGAVEAIYRSDGAELTNENVTSSVKPQDATLENSTSVSSAQS